MLSTSDLLLEFPFHAVWEKKFTSFKLSQKRKAFYLPENIPIYYVYFLIVSKEKLRGLKLKLLKNMRTNT